MEAAKPAYATNVIETHEHKGDFVLNLSSY
jgi:hypothetical protein